jgi:hypothetical protein
MKMVAWLLFATADAFSSAQPMAVLPWSAAVAHSKNIIASTHRHPSSVVDDDAKTNQQEEKILNEASSTVDNIPRGGDSNNISQPPPPLPTRAQFRKFALPCLGLWVAQPLLLLVDSAFVSLLGGGWNIVSMWGRSIFGSFSHPYSLPNVSGMFY